MMAEMKEIVMAMTDRVKVDLITDEIVQCLQIFDVRSWGNREKQGRFRGFLKCLIKALNLHHNVQGDFQLVATTLLKLLSAPVASKLPVPNRVAWSWVLCSEWRARHMPTLHRQLLRWNDFTKLISFYLCLKVNTTTLERNLGALLEQLRHHSGPTAADGSTMAALLGVALDGPKTPQELFERVEAVQPAGAAVADQTAKVALIPTSFSKACQKLWLFLYGRRFQYKYAKRPDDKQQKRKGPRKRGTFEAVKSQRKLASALLCKGAEAHSAEGGEPMSSFVPGICLPLPSARSSVASLQGTRWDSGKAATLGSSVKPKKHPMHLFKEHTARKRARALV